MAHHFTFTLRSLQSRHPDRDFLSNGLRRWAEALAESIKHLALSPSSHLLWAVEIRRCEVPKFRRCEVATLRSGEGLVSRIRSASQSYLEANFRETQGDRANQLPLYILAFKYLFC